MKSTLAFALFSYIFPLSIAVAGEFQEQAMCSSVKADAAFPRISVQVDPTNAKRGLLILQASDGWTQVYSGSIRQDTKTILFKEERETIKAIFNKDVYTASMTFNADEYLCDERSFGN